MQGQVALDFEPTFGNHVLSEYNAKDGNDRADNKRLGKVPASRTKQGREADDHAILRVDQQKKFPRESPDPPTYRRQSLCEEIEAVREHHENSDER